MSAAEAKISSIVTHEREKAALAAFSGDRALNYEENLLWEKEFSDSPGVDLPEPEGIKLRTGAPARDKVGLPQISEPQVLRHFVRMSTWNYSIDHGFFPLGSCTMKHNPRLNEKMARLKGFAHIHPMQPEDTVQGARNSSTNCKTGWPNSPDCPASA